MAPERSGEGTVVAWSLPVPRSNAALHFFALQYAAEFDCAWMEGAGGLMSSSRGAVRADSRAKQGREQRNTHKTSAQTNGTQRK